MLILGIWSRMHKNVLVWLTEGGRSDTARVHGGEARVFARVRLQKRVAFQLFCLLELLEGFGMHAASMHKNDVKWASGPSELQPSTPCWHARQNVLEQFWSFSLFIRRIPHNPLMTCDIMKEQCLESPVCERRRMCWYCHHLVWSNQRAAHARRSSLRAAQPLQLLLQASQWRHAGL